MKKEIDFCGQTGHSRIIINESISQLPSYTNGAKAVIITDENVNRYHRRLFPSAAAVIILGAGERIKTLQTAEFIYKRLLRCGVDKSFVILGIGGGVVCDITGFVASTFMRGLNFGFVPTTLLAQVDAAIGGKNGVNLAGFKNMIGVINQPCFVLIDFSLLKTLPAKELFNGFSEIVKSAAIASKSLFSLLERSWNRALELEKCFLERIVYEAVKIKTHIVQNDEKDKTERKKLNFGHTFAHAFEKSYRITHGEAVSMGMVIAANLSVKKGMIAEDDAARIRELLQKFNLPVRIRLDQEKVFKALHKDKKRRGTMVDFVLLKSIGEAFIYQMPFQEMEKEIDDLCES
jgi:3-dehydroquinate synthase